MKKAEGFPGHNLRADLTKRESGGRKRLPKTMMAHWTWIEEDWECRYCPVRRGKNTRMWMELHTARHFSTRQYRG